ncbi:MAG: (d)CMP kinase [Chloroflexota bacterium]
MNKKLIIAIDGPAGSGKTTSAKIVAEKLGYIYIDTGAMYRAVTLAWLRSGSELTEDNVAEILDKIEIKLEQSPDGQRTLLDGEDVGEQIRTPDVTKFVSPVSAMPLVREKMVEQQREIGSRGGCVLDGRDIGTVVFPQADLKIFLVATIESRAERRRKELAAKGIAVEFGEMKKQIEDRDRYDSSRAMSPLRKADDAIEIDTSNLTIEEQTNKILIAASKIAES